MKKIKLACVMFLFCISSILLTGCTASEYAIVNYSDGSSEHIFAMLVDENVLVECGLSKANATAVKNHFKSRMTNFKQSMTTAYINSINELDVSAEKKTELKNGIESKIDEKDNVISLHFIFKASENYLYFSANMPYTNTKKDFQIDEGVFLSKETTVITTMYGQKYDSDDLFSPTVAKHYYDEYHSLIASYGGEAAWFKLLEKTTLYFNFSYITTSSRIHSDAETVVDYGGSFLHTWQFGPNDNCVITLYNYKIHTFAWYLLAIGLTLLFLTVLFCVVAIQKYNNNKNLSKKLTV